MYINRDHDGVVLSLARDHCVLADLAAYERTVTTKLFDELLDFMTDPEIYYFSIPRFLEDYPRLVAGVVHDTKPVQGPSENFWVGML